MAEYVLGSSDHELERLALQHEVWREATDDFLERLDVPVGGRVLDLGCGPGDVLALLRARVGPTGEVIGVDESPRWMEHLQARITAASWSNVRVQHARLQELDVEPASVDLIFMRWVLSFQPERELLLGRLARFLKPGGAVAVMDYNHEGVSLFPHSDGFDAAIRATRAWYETTGGDTWIMGSITRLFAAADLEPFVLRPYVIAGGPGSPAFRWADAFFPYHAPRMVEAGLLSEEERRLFLDEWAQRSSDPNTLFFSPIVVGSAARKEG